MYDGYDVWVGVGVGVSVCVDRGVCTVVGVVVHVIMCVGDDVWFGVGVGGYVDVGFSYDVDGGCVDGV